MTREPDSLVGRVLCDTYQLSRLLVSGGMATVFAARHLRTGGVCAVKVLSEEATNNLEIYERFQDEARISCSLRHPNIVQVMDLDQMEDGTPFLVMELLEGEDLHDRLHRRGRLPIGDALRLAREVGSALHTAHCRDVVHRDLKPQNIFLARVEIDGQLRETAKVLDFGLSKIRRPAARATRDQLVLGTPRYLAPEAALGQNSQLDGRADQFSLAVILYRALSGRLPFDAEEVVEILRQVVYAEPPPLSELAPEVPAHVRAAIERAMCKDKEDRFAAMLDFIEALEGLGAAPTMMTGAHAAAASAPPTESPPQAEAGGRAPSVALTGILPVPEALAEAAAAPHGAGRGFTQAPTFVAPLQELVGSGGLVPRAPLPEAPEASPAALMAQIFAADPLGQDDQTPARTSAQAPALAAEPIGQGDPTPARAPGQRLAEGSDGAPRVAWTRTLVGFGAGALLALPLLFALRGAGPGPGAAAGASRREAPTATVAQAAPPRLALAPKTGGPGAAAAPPASVPSGHATSGSVPSGSVPSGSVPAGSVPSGSVPSGSPPAGSDPSPTPARPGAAPAPPSPAELAVLGAYPPLRLGDTPGPVSPRAEPPPGLLGLGRAAYERGDHLRAIAILHLALGQRPADPALYDLLLGEAACRAGRLRLALQVHGRLPPAEQAQLEAACLARGAGRD